MLMSINEPIPVEVESALIIFGAVAEKASSHFVTIAMLVPNILHSSLYLKNQRLFFLWL